MPLFHRLLLAALIAVGVVLVYDLFQAQIEQPREAGRIVYDADAGRFTFETPLEPVRIIYASMFGPGEPVMRVREKWISKFETEYAARLSEGRASELSPADRAKCVAALLGRVKRSLPDFRRRMDDLAATDAARRGPATRALAAWLEARGVVVRGSDPALDEAGRLHQALAGLEALARDAAPADKVTVAPRLTVSVERRWQGRWVLSANRPRFLTGREVPDIIEGAKEELLALVQDDYAVPLDVPLPGETLSPLDQPDTYGNPARRWRDAFIPSMLAQGSYETAPPERRAHTYLATFTCFTYCLFYNEVLFRRAGIDKPPRTWPQFIAVCDKLKAAGIHPLTADMECYADAWLTWLIYRAVGPEAWMDTALGKATAAAGGPRVSDPPWTDPRYREVFAQIRLLRERGYFDPAFAGSLWPAAQRAFASGSAAMMINGSWLVQELGGYQDVASADSFQLKCFSFPQWPGGRPEDQTAAYAIVSGLMVCRQGNATRHAIELVKYLSARDHPDMVHKNSQISCMRDADFPPALAGIADDFRNAPRAYGDGPSIYARRFWAAVLLPMYDTFFLAKKASAGEFAARLKERTDAYLSRGGEGGYE